MVKKKELIGHFVNLNPTYITLTQLVKNVQKEQLLKK